MAMVIWEARSILVCFDPKKSKLRQYSRFMTGVNVIMRLDTVSNFPRAVRPRTAGHI